MHPAILILVIVLQAPGAVVIDRIAVIAGKHAIKASDIERDLRITEFLNHTGLDLSAAARKKSADRLVDQSIIRNEMALGDYHRASDSDVDNMLGQVRHNRYADSEASLRQELTRYGLTEDELKEALLWQLTVLRFIDERFRPAVMVNDEEIRTYHTAHLAELKKQYPRDSSLATLTPAIRTLLQEQEVDQQFEAWLDGARKSEQIAYKDVTLK
jgi:hypothetical protein